MNKIFRWILVINNNYHPIKISVLVLKSLLCEWSTWHPPATEYKLHGTKNPILFRWFTVSNSSTAKKTLSQQCTASEHWDTGFRDIQPIKNDLERERGKQAPTAGITSASRSSVRIQRDAYYTPFLHYICRCDKEGCRLFRPNRMKDISLSENTCPSMCSLARSTHIYRERSAIAREEVME